MQADCGYCRARMSVADHLEGKMVRCPTCGQPTRVEPAGRAPAPRQRRGPKPPTIIVEAGFRPGREIPLANEETTIGRGEDCDVALFGDSSVEMLHALIVREEDGFYLIDQKSRSGSYVNESRVRGSARLQTGDLIGIGKSQLRFEQPQRAQPAPRRGGGKQASALLWFVCGLTLGLLLAGGAFGTWLALSADRREQPVAERPRTEPESKKKRKIVEEEEPAQKEAGKEKVEDKKADNPAPPVKVADKKPDAPKPPVKLEDKKPGPMLPPPPKIEDIQAKNPFDVPPPKNPFDMPPPKDPPIPPVDVAADKKTRIEVIPHGDVRLHEALGQDVRNGWLKTGAFFGHGNLELIGWGVNDRGAKPGQVPIIALWSAKKAKVPPGMLSTLPHPTVPFMIDAHTQNFTGGHLKELANFKKLTGLSLQYSPITDDDLKHFIGCEQLQALNLSYTKVTQGPMTNLGKLTQLRSLSLNSLKVTDAMVKDILPLKNLWALDVAGNALTDEGLKDLLQFKELRVLWVHGSKQLTNESLKVIAQMKDLEVLQLDGIKNINDEGVKELAKLTKLKSLRMWEVSVTDAGLRHLLGLVDLETIGLLGNNVSAAGVKDLLALPKLHTLHVQQTRVTRQEAQQLMQMFPNVKIYP